MENKVANRLNSFGIFIGLINFVAGVGVSFMELDVYGGSTGYTFATWSPISLVYGGILIFTGLITYFLFSGFATLIENSSKQVKLLELIADGHKESLEVEEAPIEETISSSIGEETLVNGVPVIRNT